jgi:hypothetical protein
VNKIVYSTSTPFVLSKPEPPVPAGLQKMWDRIDKDTSLSPEERELQKIKAEEYYWDGQSYPGEFADEDY